VDPGDHKPCNKKFFLKKKIEAKDCLNLLIKKKRIAQLINGKPDENRYNKTTRERHLKPATSKPIYTLNLQQRAHNTWSSLQTTRGQT
jgi:hypothetical protein